MENKTKSNNTVTINGKLYDEVTGLAIESSNRPEKTLRGPISASGIHSNVQKSQTLNRQATKKPILHTASQLTRKVGHSMDIARSRSIARFAPHPVTPIPQTPKVTHDIAPMKHPAVAKAAAKQISKQTPTASVNIQKTPQAIKQDAIQMALASSKPKTAKKTFFKRRPRRFAIVAMVTAVVLVSSYLFYLTMPSLSVRVASAQANIAAVYPQYIPDGYSINGPVTYSDGQVTINFVANAGKKTFTIKQAKSYWDSSAVLDNIVRKKAGENYLTTQENGLTIFTYSGNAAWANAGILYTITGDAPLTGEQIRHIATSM